MSKPSTIITQSAFTFLRSKKAEPLLQFCLVQARTSKGFTLIELLISIVIIVILSVIGISSFNVANNRNELRNQAKEIVSEMRKIRTDSVAASKPTTGPTTATSCKSPNTTPDTGVFYGTYITFGANNFATGVSCWSAGTSVGGGDVSTALKQDIAQSITGAVVGDTIFFAFNGNTYQIAGKPATETAASSPSGQITNTPVKITLAKGGESYYVYVNGTGLVCTEKADSGADNCADTP